jgi:hypothetical protein
MVLHFTESVYGYWPQRLFNTALLPATGRCIRKVISSKVAASPDDTREAAFVD